MEKEDLNTLIELRADLIKSFERIRDYKTNPNAIMKEVDHASFVHKTIVKIDKLLKRHVNFS